MRGVSSYVILDQRVLTLVNVGRLRAFDQHGPELPASINPNFDQELGIILGVLFWMQTKIKI